MRYVETHTSTPIPRVHLAEFDSTNAVGTRFMLMDRIVGSSLGKVWPTLQPEGRETVVRQLAGSFQAELLKLEFPVLGSVVDEQGIVGSLSCSCTHPPLLGLKCGPFKSTKDYMLANIYAELKLVQERYKEKKQCEDRKALTDCLGDTSLQDTQK
ncbi:hypothetical protein ARMGADRAFT_1015922 [Armillaria gallica]|uniref:Aminoglycoside phosphotransferase domain-containing protein n=1 Tax=Armillaria gallica TaxID=47427 RepID=A0A2H3DC55_ARMGA|nr:hypothetical protein ARMGADRAFT_1015922 [Armillaria gallica]